MPILTGSKILLSIGLLFMLPVPALAIPAITCHCFTDRTFEPARPGAADPYFLATTQNSFFALVFNTDKKTVVMKKQQGTSSDDLWIAYWVASKSGTSPENLLREKQGKLSWDEVLAPMRLSTKALGSRFSSALKTKSSTKHLAETVVDDLLTSYRMHDEAELAAMRQLGASSQELIISAVISARMGRPAKQLIMEVKSGTKTWGQLLQWAQIDTRNMQQEVSTTLHGHNRQR